MEPTCTEAQENEVSFVPMGVQNAVVGLHNYGGNERLYLAVVTLPANTCIKDRVRRGALILYVQQGSVTYFAQESEVADPVIRRGASADNSPVATVDLETLATLDQGDWISQDRRVEFTLANSGPGDAVIVTAVFALTEWTDAACKHRCRDRP